MKLGNKGQVKTWLVGLLASAIVVTGGFFNSNLDNVLAALPSRLNDRQMQTFVDLGFNQAATRVVISGGQLMLDSTVNIEIGNVEPQLDNTDIQAVSLWARNVAPGDTSVFVDSDGHLQVDILSPTVAGDSAGTSSDEGFLMIGAVTGNGFEHEIVSVDSDGHLQIDIISGGSMAAGAEKDEDTGHTTGDTGNFVLGVANEGQNQNGADQRYTYISTDRRGNLLAVPWHNNTLSPTESVSAEEDSASGDEFAGLKILTVRDDVLTANAGTGADGDYTWARVDNRGAAWTHNDPVDAQLDLQVAASATADGTTIDVSGVNLVLVHVINSGTWDRSGTLIFEGFMGVSPNPVERTLPYIEFQGEGSGLATDPIGRRAQSQTLSSISSSELGFLVDVRGFQGFRARLTVTGGAAGTVSIHAHLVKNSEGVFNAAMALVQTSDGTSGVPDFSLQTRDINSENLLSEIEDIASSTDSAATNINFITRRVDDVAGATDRGVAALLLRDDVLTPAGITPADGDYVRGRTDASGATWVRNATVTQSLFVGVSTTSSSTIVDVAGYTMGMVHYTNDATFDRTGTFAINVSIGASSPFKPVVGAIEVRQSPPPDTVWQHTDPEAISLLPVANRTRGYMINLMGFQALQVDVTITDAGTSGVSEFHIHLYSGGSGFNQEMALGADSLFDSPVIGGPPPLAQQIGGRASNFGMRHLYLPDEDAASADADPGIPAMVIRDDVLTAGGGVGTDLDYNMLRVDNFGGMWSRMYVVDGEGSFIGLTGSGGRLFVTSIVSTVTPGVGATNLGKAEDTPHTTGDTGVMGLSVNNRTASILFSATVGDYVPTAVSTTGFVLSIPSNDGIVSATIAAVNNEDVSAIAGEAGMKILALRDDALVSGALVSADGDYTQLRLDNFGALWNTPTDGAGTAVFTAPVTLGDALANPTVTQVGAMTMFFNPCNATWERSKDEGSGLFVVVQGTVATTVGNSVALVATQAGDSIAINTDALFPGGYIVDAVLSTIVQAEGDYAQSRIDTFGSAWTTATDGAGNILAQIEDVAHVTGDPGIFALAVVNSGFATLAANGDYTAFAVTGIGASMGVLVHDSTVGNTVRMSKAEDTPSFDGTPGFVAMTVRDDALTANTGTTTDGDHTFIRVDNFGAAWTTATDGAGNILAQIEDVAHADGDPGIMGLGVVNSNGLAIASATGDYVPSAHTTEGYALSLPVFDSSIAGQTQMAAVADGADSTSGFHAGMVMLGLRDDVLTTATSADNDFTTLHTDSLGALWTRNHNAVQELGITELIGINEQVDAAEYSASVTTTLTGTGAITKVCLVATEDGSGAIQTPNGTLIIFDADPAIVAGDTAITAGERTTILAQLTFSSVDYQEDVNGASNCQATEEIYHTDTLFATWFLAAGEPSFNDVAGDDEQFEMNVLYRTDSL